MVSHRLPISPAQSPGKEVEMNAYEAWNTRYVRWQYVVALGFTVFFAIAWVS